MSLPWSGLRSAPRGLALGALAFALAACDAATTLEPRNPALRPDGDAMLATAPSVSKLLVSIDSGVDRKTWSVTVGKPTYFSIIAYDHAGKVIPAAQAPAAKYKSSKTGVFVIDSVRGVGQAVTPGHFQVTVTAGGLSTTLGLNSIAASTTTTATAATSPTPTTPSTPAPSTPTTSTPTTPALPATSGSTATAAPTAGASSVNVNVVRFDAGAGPVTVSSALPLKPGTLRPGQANAVRVTVGGTEQAVYVSELPSLHTDGSLRAVLVQFKLSSLATTGAAGRVDFSATPRPSGKTLTTPVVTPGTPAAGTPAGLPQAAALPTDPSYLIATDLVGATKTPTAVTSLGTAFSRYESDFVTFSTKHWAAEGANWAGNYYDRALIYYAMWARTGDPTYWARAGQIAYDYRTKYLEANAYGASPHWAQLEGLEKHYLLTGDDKSRQAVGKTAAKLYGAFNNTAYLRRSNGEGRIAARVLHAQLLAWRLGTASAPLNSQSPAAWGNQVESIFGQIAAWQQPDGSFPADGQLCGGQLNYMIGLQNDALIKTYEQYVPASTSRATLQARIKTTVVKAVDYMWSTQWVAAKRGFQYVSVDCTAKNVGSTNAAPDLNNLISTGFAWVYNQTRDARYLAAADQIFVGGVTQAYLAGSKQFNENYTSSFRFLGYR